MTPEDLDRVGESFTSFHEQFAALFGRREAKQRSEQYPRGLLVQHAERRNIAEAAPGATARARQRFLTDAPWQYRPVISALHDFLGPRLSSPDGVFIFDETAAKKQGKHSVGVARQYSGTLGKVGNCQVGVYLAYASSRAHALLDGDLYLPQEWIAAAKRRQRTGVAPSVALQTKGDLALALLTRAQAGRHFQGGWVTGAAVYGSDSGLRDGVAQAGNHYVFEVRCNERVFTMGCAS